MLGRVVVRDSKAHTILGVFGLTLTLTITLTPFTLKVRVRHNFRKFRSSKETCLILHHHTPLDDRRRSTAGVALVFVSRVVFCAGVFFKARYVCRYTNNMG